MRTHYPRTPHVPWSPGAGADDIRAGDLSGLRGREVVVTEKLDGENTTLYPDGLHARSLDSAHHPSRAWVKALQGRIGARIPAGWRVCGENMYARHSISYDALESWFYGFSVWAGDHCLDWDASTRFLRRLGVPSPPVLWRGVFDERALRAIRLDPTRQEGFVVRSVEGFGRAEFGLRVAKWVRRGHVRTDTHWMHAAVVANGVGPDAALWAVRSGANPDLAALLAAVGTPEVPATAAEVVSDVCARLDVLGRSGDARLAGVLAAALHAERRADLAPRLAPALGMPQARRVADLVGLQARLRELFPDDERRGGLARLTVAADVGVLHAVAGAVLVGGTGPEADDAREQVEWSALIATDAGLTEEAPLAPLRARARDAFAGLAPDVADRCWAHMRDAYARDWPMPPEATRGWWAGTFPRLIHLVGRSGSGKSTFARELPGVDAYIGLDDLRRARGSRADQTANGDVLREGLDRLDAALAGGGTVVWDATSLNKHQRAPVQEIARRRDALTTHAVVLVDDDALARRNAEREHPVPPAALAAQARRFAPPYPGQAHRTWYIGAGGELDDVAGALDAEDA
ncbi:RNA ligase family protein [Embleya sp. NBC_00896]|uniref:RNA ligase family protein n=1 Tax=Embleya sp. NBC_00896 TaxID=2975961 RepID=UPI002F91441C|nr:AAA family ATPase [Embleya sp. NBC_00896]